MTRAGSRSQVPGGLFLGPAYAGDSCCPADHPIPGGLPGAVLGLRTPNFKAGPEDRTGQSQSPLRLCLPDRHCLLSLWVASSSLPGGQLLPAGAVPTDQQPTWMESN